MGKLLLFQKGKRVSIFPGLTPYIAYVHFPPPLLVLNEALEKSPNLRRINPPPPQVLKMSIVEIATDP